MADSVTFHQIHLIQMFQQNVTGSVGVAVDHETARRTLEQFPRSNVSIENTTSATCLGREHFVNFEHPATGIFSRLMFEELTEAVMGPGQHFTNGLSVDSPLSLLHHIRNFKRWDQDRLVLRAKVFRHVMMEIINEVPNLQPEAQLSLLHSVALFVTYVFLISLRDQLI
jgi:hypothetical protein